ncbi:MAG TPA: hypothetical protein VF228_08870 [Iamia sp.]
MGNFYVNVTLLDVGIDDVRRAAPRPSFVGAVGTDAVVYAAADDAGAPIVGAELTRALGCTGISVGVHDDDLLFWEVHRTGESVASGAVPDPAVVFGLGEDEIARPEGDAAADLVAALGRGDVEVLRAVLDADHTFATDRHVAFVDALQLPQAAVGWGYRYVEVDWPRDDPELPPIEHLA